AIGQEALTNGLLVQLRGQDTEVLLVFLLFAGEFADENVVGVRSIDPDPAEIAQEVTPDLPAIRQIMGLDMAEDQAEHVLDLAQQFMLLPNGTWDLVNNVDIVGRACGHAADHGGYRAGDGDLYSLVDLLAE